MAMIRFEVRLMSSLMQRLLIFVIGGILIGSIVGRCYVATVVKQVILTSENNSIKRFFTEHLTGWLEKMDFMMSFH